jgi:hypothetical protein
LLLVTDRTVGVGQTDIDRLEMMPLEKGGHRRPGGRRDSALRYMLADTADGQRRNGRHGKSPLNDAHCRVLFHLVQLGASLGANEADRMTQ